MAESTTSRMTFLSALSGWPARATFEVVATRPDGKRKRITITVAIDSDELYRRLLAEVKRGDEVVVTLQETERGPCAMRLLQFRGLRTASLGV